MASDADFAWALSQFRENERLTLYSTARAYYRGDHPMAFATEKFRTAFWKVFRGLNDNLCGAVIDSLNDRLEITGFEAGYGTDDALAKKAERIWSRNRMKLRANEVHREAILCGDGYVMVWPDAQKEATFWPQSAHEVAVVYSADKPGVISLAAKLWESDDKKVRLSLYYPDRTERWISTRQVGSTHSLSDFNRSHFVPYVEPLELAYADPSSVRQDGVVANPYGVVPIFHFPNRLLHQQGLSELLDVIPLQDALNKTLLDQMVAQEFAGWPQRWVTGMELDADEKTGLPKPPPFDVGVDRIIGAFESDAKFGQFQAVDLRQFLEAQESLRREISRVSGTPPHYLSLKGDFPSGEALKASEARFTRKIRDRQSWFGTVWEDALTFALQIEGATLPDPPEDRVLTKWHEPSPRSEREIAEVALMKQAMGVSREQLLRELGYTDEQIAKMADEKSAGAIAAAKTMQITGQTPDSGNGNTQPVDVRSFTGNGNLNVTPPR